MDILQSTATTTWNDEGRQRRFWRLSIGISLFVLAGCSTGGEHHDYRGMSSPKVSAAAPIATTLATSSRPESTALIIRSGSLELEAENVLTLKPEITQITADAGGQVTHSSQRDNDYLHMTLRIPEPLLDRVMAHLASLADVKSISLSSSDVTDQVLDLQARLNSMRALRDRLLSYLERTANLDEILKVERELTRVQSDIERMEGSLKRLKSQVAMSTLIVQVSEKKKRWW